LLKELVWCQEEPENQGAWLHLRRRFQALVKPGQSLFYAGRPEAAAPAPGYYQLHARQQERLVLSALASQKAKQKAY
ncbi:MAG: hypothetical protein HKM24_03175, partial [Gammaproteobacteria bacterium]|nr:hypothetical protein [Gammaproteobacteria bacterium]